MSDPCCTYYNRQSGCRRNEECRYLHVCRFYLLDQCKFNPCQRSHDLTTKHAKSVLDSLGLGVSVVGVSRVRQALKIRIELSAHQSDDVKEKARESPKRALSSVQRQQSTDSVVSSSVRHRPVNEMSNPQRQLSSSVRGQLQTTDVKRGLPLPASHCSQPVRKVGGSTPSISRIPPVCRHYMAAGCDNCSCKNLHICSFFLAGTCRYAQCKRSHNVLSDQPKAVLVECGFNVVHMSEQQIVEKLGETLRDLDIKRQATRQKDVPRETSAPDDAAPKMCSYYLFGRCIFKNNDCHNYHSPNNSGLPYQWQWSRCSSDGDYSDNDDDCVTDRQWHDFDPAANAELESRYCNPAEEQSKTKDNSLGEVVVNFESMTFGGRYGDEGEVRRLGTESAATATKRNRYTTEWLWYHRTSGSPWEAYPDAAKSRVGAHVHAASNADSLCSNSLELAFLRNPEGQWQCDNHDKTRFNVDFKSMTVLNLTTRKLSWIRRRPELYRPTKELSAALPKGSDAYPKHWDINSFQGETRDYVLVRLQSSGPTANEYMEVAKLFGKTMPDVKLKSVKRIQNRDLWESFDIFRSRMNRKRLTPATEMSLFHGTREQYVEAICQQGFDWRMCGTSVGTKWGKGSYFARDAHYSKSYTDCKKMFLVKVVVGDYTVGNPSLVRPPPKDPSNPHQDLYDSVVDNVCSPSIFVTFERHQSYPEYLLRY